MPLIEKEKLIPLTQYSLLVEQNFKRLMQTVFFVVDLKHLFL